MKTPVSPGPALSESGEHNVNLDFARGIASLLVLMTHTFECQFLSPGQEVYQTWTQKIFYYFCSLGGDAVMVFFVLSGFLVGGSVVKQVDRDKWSWTDYLVRRLTRLWIVLVPALLLTVVWDSLGIGLGGKYAYDGNYWNLIWVGAFDHHNFAMRDFFRNLFFLQNTPVPGMMYGSNSPLWSLSNEFWYYVLFPFLYGAIASKSHPAKRIFYILVFVGIIELITKDMAYLGIVWLMGVLVYMAVNRPWWNKIFSNFPVFALSFLFLLAVTLAGHLNLAQGRLAKILEPSQYPQQCMVGIAFTLMVPYLLKCPFRWGFYTMVSKWLSKMSYTLYLTHLPLLLFFFYLFVLPQKSTLTPANFLLFLLYVSVALVYGWGVWYFFERRTIEFREWAFRIFRE